MNDDIAEILDSRKHMHAPQPGPGEPSEGTRLIAPGIIVRPGMRSGRPCIEGTSLRVTDIATLKKYWDMSADEIVNYYQLERSQVDAALAYYAAHRQAIDADMEEQNEIDERLANTEDARRNRAAVLSRRESLARNHRPVALEGH